MIQQFQSKTCVPVPVVSDPQLKMLSVYWYIQVQAPLPTIPPHCLHVDAEQSRIASCLTGTSLQQPWRQTSDGCISTVGCQKGPQSSNQLLLCPPGVVGCTHSRAADMPQH